MRLIPKNHITVNLKQRFLYAQVASTKYKNTLII